MHSWKSEESYLEIFVTVTPFYVVRGIYRIFASVCFSPIQYNMQDKDQLMRCF